MSQLYIFNKLRRTATDGEHGSKLLTRNKVSGISQW